jgi:ribulose kinase
MAEIIKVIGNKAYVQVFESTRGLKTGALVEFSGAMLEVTLGPGVLSKNYDGLQHDLDAMVRAVMESTAFAMRDVISVMEDAGAHVEDLRSTGMPAQSAIWNQIKADITGKPVKVPAFSEPELAGCLAIGRFALGEEKSLAQAAEHVFAPRAIFEPRWEYAALYDELFSVYRETYRRLVDLFPLLRRAGHTAGSAQEEKP